MELSTEILALIMRYFGLNEAMRSDQSNEALRAELEKSLNGWVDRPGEEMRVVWTFSDRLIAWCYRNDYQRLIWEISWARNDAGFTFGAPVEVKEVQLYEPVNESRRDAKNGRFQETLTQSLALTESAAGAKRIKAIGITADVVNGNKRRYPRSVLAAAVAKLNGNLRESAGQGRLIATGEAEHPSDKGGRPNILETVVKWETASLDASGKVLIEGIILPTKRPRCAGAGSARHSGRCLDAWVWVIYPGERSQGLDPRSNRTDYYGL
jgi:hypothetical protein